MPRKKIVPVEPDNAGKGEVAASELVAALNAVLPLAGRDDTLPMLTSVKFESDGDELTLAATDRYVLGAYRIPWDGGHVDAVLRSDGARDLLVWAKKVGKYVPAITLTFSKSEVEAFDFERKATFPLYTDGEFVKWRAVLPADDPSDLVFGVNKDYIGRFAKAGEKGEPLRVTFRSPTKILGIQIGERFTGAIMPVRLPDQEQKPSYVASAPTHVEVDGVTVAETRHIEPEPEVEPEPERVTEPETTQVKCGQCKGFGVVRKYGSSKGDKYKTAKGAQDATEKGNSAPCPSCQVAQAA